MCYLNYRSAVQIVIVLAFFWPLTNSYVDYFSFHLPAFINFRLQSDFPIACGPISTAPIFPHYFLI